MKSKEHSTKMEVYLCGWLAFTVLMKWAGARVLFLSLWQRCPAHFHPCPPQQSIRVGSSPSPFSHLSFVWLQMRFCSGQALCHHVATSCQCWCSLSCFVCGKPIPPSPISPCWGRGLHVPWDLDYTKGAAQVACSAESPLETLAFLSLLQIVRQYLLSAFCLMKVSKCLSSPVGSMRSVHSFILPSGWLSRRATGALEMRVSVS